MKSILFTYLFFCSVQLLSQNFDVRFRPYLGNIVTPPATQSYHTYGEITLFPTPAIAEDFGPRILGDYDWHSGVDYNSAQNDGNAKAALSSLT